jgi:hypothetical protein
MNIRSYSQSDRHACLEILESNTPEFFIPTDCDGYGAFLDNLPGPYFVLEEFGQIAACGGWAMDADGVADLTWGMVRRDLHRRGLGRELLRFGSTRSTTTAGVVDVVLDGFGAGLDKVTMESVLSSPNKRCSEPALRVSIYESLVLQHHQLRRTRAASAGR